MRNGSRSHADGDGVGGVSLQLDRVRAGVFGGLNDLYRLLEILIVIGGELGDHIDRAARTDAALANVELRSSSRMTSETARAHQLKGFGGLTSRHRTPTHRNCS